MNPLTGKGLPVSSGQGAQFGSRTVPCIVFAHHEHDFHSRMTWLDGGVCTGYDDIQPPSSS